MSFVYVISNESIPGYVKIGYTSKEPEKRIDELFTTSVPTPFKAEKIYEFESEDLGQKVEKFLHSYFDKSRLEKNREFFSSDILTTIDHTVKVNFPNYIKKLERYIQKKKKEEEEFKEFLKRSREKNSIKEILNEKINNFDELTIEEKNKTVSSYINNFIINNENFSWYSGEDMGYLFALRDISQIKGSYYKIISEHLYKLSLKRGEKSLFNTRKDLDEFVRGEYYLQLPSKKLSDYVYAKYSKGVTIHHSIRGDLHEASVYFSYHKKYIKMNIECGNFSKKYGENL